MGDFILDYPIIGTIVIIVVAFVAAFMLSAAEAVLITFLTGGFQPHHYEYIDADGETHVAEYCDLYTTGYHPTPYCRLEDGTIVYEFKSARKVMEAD